MRKAWKKKSHEKARREAVADFVQGGGQIDPPPQVKIGLKADGGSAIYYH